MNQVQRERLAEFLSLSPIIPVVTIDEAKDAARLAQALIAAGMPIIEVTLRTEAALDSIRRIRAEVPDIVVGAGTVWSAQALASAAGVGAQFAVSPASPGRLARLEKFAIPLLPGCQTITEMAELAELGFIHVKLFPAQSAGGPGLLAAAGSVLPHLRFCPTGGITAKNLADYLNLPNVVCVGGSWIAPPADIAAGAWDAITQRAVEARKIAESTLHRC